MITCPRCGQPLRAPVPACPQCGQRFAPPAPPQQRMSQATYQAREFDGSAPTWVRQVQQSQQSQQPRHPQYPPAPQQPAYSPAPGAALYGQPQSQSYNQHAASQQQPPSVGQPAARPGFSISELVSEEALPDWLRQASVESGQPTQRQPIPGAPASASSAYPPAYPPTYPAAYPPANQPAAPLPADEPFPRPDASAFPTLESAGSYQAPLAGGGGMSASSLLDPNALPTWLGGQPGQAPAEGMRGGEGMRAQSLVDDAALPEWMRNQPASPAQAPVAPPPAAAPGWEGYSAAAPAAAFPPIAPVPPVAPIAPPLSPAPAAPYTGMAGMQPPISTAPAPANGQPGFSASQLIDPNALPDWMQAQGGAPGMAPAPVMRQPASQANQAGWSASDLIDPAMLPGWVRGDDAASAQASVARPALPATPPASALPTGPASQDYDAPFERTGRVPAPRNGAPADAGASARHRAAPFEQADPDFGASRAGTAHRGAVSRKYPAARPLDEHEKPAWLRDDGDDVGQMGQDGMDPYAAGHRQWNTPSRNGHGAYGDPQGQPEPTGRRRQRGQGGQADQSWAAPDGYDDSPWSRPRTAQHPRNRQDAKPAAKKRKGGLFGFLRRG